MKFAIARHVQSLNQKGVLWAVVCSTSQNNISIWKTGFSVSPCNSLQCSSASLVTEPLLEKPQM